jgi:predicted  nucleic acid-binding Zn-ribbon protein
VGFDFHQHELYAQASSSAKHTLLHGHATIYNRDMSRVSNLFSLQEIDRSIAKAHERIAEIEAQLEDDAAVQQAFRKVKSVDDHLTEVRSEHSAAEHAVQSQRTKIKQNESALYGGSVTNPKELEDLQMEQESLKRYLETLEDRYLEAMMELDEAETAFENADAELDLVKAQSAAENADLVDEKKTLQKNIERQESEREAILGNISSEDLATYQKLQDRFQGIAVAKVVGGNCSICGVDLARSKMQAIQSGSELIRCSQCNRILYSG